MVVVIQLRRRITSGAGRGLGLAVDALQFFLNGYKFLSEKVFLLLFREGFADDGSNLVADFGDRRELNEQLGDDLEACFGIGRSEDF